MSISPLSTYPPNAKPADFNPPFAVVDTAPKKGVAATVARFLNDTIAIGSPHEFSVAIDPKTRQAVVRIVDRTTRAVIEQLPSEYLLQVAQHLSESLAQQSARSADKTLTK